MALDMERPSSVHSPDHSVSSSGNFGGVLPATLHHQLLRSSSPEEERGSSPASGDTSHRGTLHESRRDGGPQQGPLPAHPLTFSIEKILSPDFGRPTPRERRDSFLSSGLPAVDTPKVGHSKETRSKENSRDGNKDLMWPAWVYCTRYSDRPSSGPRRIRSKQTGKCGTSSAGQECSEDDQSPRCRRIKKKEKKPDEKRPRTAFTAEQLTRLKQEFQENRYLTEKRRQDLARDLKLNESQIKIWFQNKRAKIKKASGQRNPLALQLMAQGLYNHSTVPLRDDEDDERPKSSSSS